MAAKLFLVFCAGCSGGSWLESVCNTHPQVRAWEEISRTLGFIGQGLQGRRDVAAMSDDAVRNMYQTIIWFLDNQSRRHRAVGLIKTFNNLVLEYGLERNARVIQLTRNPIKVVGFKFAKTAWELRQSGRTSQFSAFIEHVKKYAARYQTYLARAERFPIIRAEALSASLATSDAAYFCRVMEYLTRVVWDAEIVERVRQSAHPRGRNDIPSPDCWKSDWFVEFHYGSLASSNEPRARGAHTWETWDNWQRGIFVEHFEPIMTVLGYDYGD